MTAVAPALAALVDSGTVRVLDAAVLHEDADGQVTGAELEDEDGAAFAAVDGDVLELLSDDDLLQIAATLQPSTTTLVLLWENRWAAAFGDAVRQVHGTVVASDRVPRENVDRALAAGGTPAAEVPRMDEVRS
ncbi:hypothetical protein [Geodermatophilus sp. CPCC 206100]|uniref:hypothetical protein n=1 Tax=Geodermatophilus sp. CPCC 206100 TaxID=3020054 RepID=UPI003AFF80D9